ncbi:MAG TPA: DUF58 domain-containing protein [Candidatus Limnocylindrales bacterium]|nr:DUF58 domain-containing protein [Candidatus Limnocylindrales bacterium]
MPNQRNTLYLLLIGVLIGGLATGRAFFFNLAIILGALYVLSLIYSWTSVRWLAIGRKTRSRRAQVGRSLEESFSIRNRSPLPKLWVEVRDESTLPGHRIGQVVPTLGPYGKYNWTAKTVCRVRGEYQLGPVTIIGGDPFGLFSARRTLDARSRIIVYPDTLPVTSFELPIGLLSGGEAQRRRAATTTSSAAGVREYAPGDSFNRIHWASTARRDRLMVKEFEIDPLVDVWLFVDFSAAALVERSGLKRVNGNGPVIPRGTELPPSSEEYAVVIASSLARHFIDRERALGFAAYVPHREVYQPERGSRQLMRILQALAVARSLSTYSLAQMLALETPYFTRGTSLVVITASVEESWVNQAQIIARRGIRPVCILLDPTTFGGGPDVRDSQTMLRLARIPSIVIGCGDDITAALAQPMI